MGDLRVIVMESYPRESFVTFEMLDDLPPDPFARISTSRTPAALGNGRLLRHALFNLYSGGRSADGQPPR